MKIGRMRHQVTLQSLTVSSRDAYGEQVREWTTIRTDSAEVVTLSGREAVNSQQICAEATHRVRKRWTCPITPGQRFLFNSRAFNILHVDNVNQLNREYLILCQEVVDP